MVKFSRVLVGTLVSFRSCLIAVLILHLLYYGPTPKAPATIKFYLSGLS